MSHRKHYVKVSLSDQEVTGLDELRGARSARSTCAGLLHEPPKGAGLMLRLLPQPGGFEGVFAIEETQDPHDLAVSEIDQKGKGCFGLGSACLATPAEVAFAEEAISQVADLEDLEVQPGERLGRVSGHLADALVSPVHRRLTPEQLQERRVPLHVGVVHDIATQYLATCSG
jgi:hypothetical protein